MTKFAFIICKCSQYNSATFNKLEILQEYIALPEGSPFDYVRNTDCTICGSKVYLKFGYTKKGLLNWAMNQVAMELRGKVP